MSKLRGTTRANRQGPVGGWVDQFAQVWVKRIATTASAQEMLRGIIDVRED